MIVASNLAYLTLRFLICEIKIMNKLYWVTEKIK